MKCLPRRARALGLALWGLPLCGALLTGHAQGGEADRDLLDLPFSDLLQVEIPSAGKREEQIRDIPASVTLVTREEIERYGWVSFEELLKNIPGFYILDNLEDRFVGTRGTVGGGVQVLVNGIPQHPALQKTIAATEIARLDIPVESIDRVEIVRGPMSVIYGNNAFQGVINVVTNAIDRAGPRVSARLGSGESGGLFARLGGHTGEGFVALNASVSRDGGLKGDYARMMGPTQIQALRPDMHPDMDGDMDQALGGLDLSARWRDWQASLRLKRRDYGIYAFTPPFDDGTRVRLDTVHAALGWSHRFGDELGLKVTGIYSDEVYDAYRMDFLRPEIEGDQRQTSRRAELEATLHWRPNPALDTIAGWRFMQIDGVENRVMVPPLFDARVELLPVQTQDLFAQASWRIAPPLRLVGGVRWSLLPDEYRQIRRLRLDPIPVRLTVANEDTDPLNGQLALLWSPGPDQVLKLSWGSASQDTDQIDLPEPERIGTLEANYTMTRERWMASLGIFENRLDRLVRTIQRIDPKTGRYTNQDDNSGQWRTRGLELIAEARPIHELGLSASLTWQATADREEPLDPGYSPGLLATLKADWRQGPITYAAFAHYVDGMDADWDFVAGPTPGIRERIGESVPGYWDLGLNLRWDPPGPGPYVSLHGSNLLDTEIRWPAAELTDLERGLIGPGRLVVLTLGLVF